LDDILGKYTDEKTGKYVAVTIRDKMISQIKDEKLPDLQKVLPGTHEAELAEMQVHRRKVAVKEIASADKDASVAGQEVKGIGALFEKIMNLFKENEK